MCDTGKDVHLFFWQHVYLGSNRVTHLQKSYLSMLLTAWGYKTYGNREIINIMCDLDVMRPSKVAVNFTLADGKRNKFNYY